MREEWEGVPAEGVMLAEEGGGLGEESGENGMSGKRALERGVEEVVETTAVEGERSEMTMKSVESEPEPKKSSGGEEDGRNGEGVKDEELGEPSEGKVESGLVRSSWEVEENEEEDQEKRASKVQTNKHTNKQKKNHRGLNERDTPKRRERGARCAKAVG